MGSVSLLRAQCGEDGQLQGARLDTFHHSQASQECRHLLLRHRGVMLGGGDLGSSGHGKIAAPHCGVFASSQIAHFGGRHHALDAPAHPGPRLRLGVPDRPQHLEHKLSVDIGHRHVADDGMGKALERVPPLLRVLGVAPRRPDLGCDLVRFKSGGALEGLDAPPTRCLTRRLHLADGDSAPRASRPSVGAAFIRNFGVPASLRRPIHSLAHGPRV